MTSGSNYSIDHLCIGYVDFEADFDTVSLSFH